MSLLDSILCKYRKNPNFLYFSDFRSPKFQEKSIKFPKKSIIISKPLSSSNPDPQPDPMPSKCWPPHSQPQCCCSTGHWILWNFLSKYWQIRNFPQKFTFFRQKREGRGHPGWGGRWVQHSLFAASTLLVAHFQVSREFRANKQKLDEFLGA